MSASGRDVLGLTARERLRGGDVLPGQLREARRSDPRTAAHVLRGNGAGPAGGAASASGAGRGLAATSAAAVRAAMATSSAHAGAENAAPAAYGVPPQKAGRLSAAVQPHQRLGGTHGTVRPASVLGDITNVVQPSRGHVAKKPTLSGCLAGASGPMPSSRQAQQQQLGAAPQPPAAASGRPALAPRVSQPLRPAPPAPVPQPAPAFAVPQPEAESAAASTLRSAVSPRAAGAAALPAPRLSSAAAAVTTSAAAPSSQTTAQPRLSAAAAVAAPELASPRLLGRGAAPLVGAEPFSEVFRGDELDTQRVAEHAADIFAAMLEKELAAEPLPDYMEAQPDINAKMRAILVDWLVEVHMKYRLRSITLYLAVYIIDRFLAVHAVQRKKLQLVGVAAMFIASKYEEIHPPKAEEFRYITDNTFKTQEILDMECTILGALGFDLVVPTQAHFSDRLERLNGCDPQHRSLAHYLLYLALVEYRMALHPASALVCAALLLSNELLGRRPAWSAALEHHARRGEAALRPCVEGLRGVLLAAPSSKLQAVRKRFQLEQHHAVANLPCCRGESAA